MQTGKISQEISKIFTKLAKMCFNLGLILEFIKVVQYGFLISRFDVNAVKSLILKVRF